MKTYLESLIQRLYRKRNEIDFNVSLWLGGILTSSGRGRERRSHVRIQPKKKPVVVSGPCIVYQLHEHEILEDWTIIKKSLIELKRKEDAEKRNRKLP